MNLFFRKNILIFLLSFFFLISFQLRAFEKKIDLTEWYAKHSLFTVQDLAKEENAAIELTVLLLKEADFEIESEKFEFIFKPTTALTSVQTNKGVKFIKIHNQEGGKREYKGNEVLSHHLPVLEAEGIVISSRFEMIIYPFLSSIKEKNGMLFDLVYFETSKAIKILNRMILDIRALVEATLEFEQAAVGNDMLYFDRLKTFHEDGEVGRIEKYYSNKTLIGVAWEELLHAKMMIDGIEYEESLHGLISNAKKNLNPKNQRFTSLCHGDWHDMNVTIQGEDDYLFLDCELSGKNDIIGDAMVYLVYNAIQGDYLGLKYHPSHFYNRDQGYQKAYSYVKEHPQSFSSVYENGIIYLSNSKRFGTCLERKILSKFFIENYIEKLFGFICDRWGPGCRYLLEEKVKACLLLRLLGVYDLSRMEVHDQIKMISFIFKTIGTPKNRIDELSTLEKFTREL